MHSSPNPTSLMTFQYNEGPDNSPALKWRALHLIKARGICGGRADTLSRTQSSERQQTSEVMPLIRVLPVTEGPSAQDLPHFTTSCGQGEGGAGGGEAGRGRFLRPDLLESPNLRASGLRRQLCLGPSISWGAAVGVSYGESPRNRTPSGAATPSSRDGGEARARLEAEETDSARPGLALRLRSRPSSSRDAGLPLPRPRSLPPGLPWLPWLPAPRPPALALAPARALTVAAGGRLRAQRAVAGHAGPHVMLPHDAHRPALEGPQKQHLLQFLQHGGGAPPDGAPAPGRASLPPASGREAAGAARGGGEAGASGPPSVPGPGPRCSGLSRPSRPPPEQP